MFRGRVRTYEDDYGVKCDLVTWKDLTDDERKVVEPMAAKLTGKDRPPAGMGQPNGSNGDESSMPPPDPAAAAEMMDDDLPF